MGRAGAGGVPRARGAGGGLPAPPLPRGGQPGQPRPRAAAGGGAPAERSGAARHGTAQASGYRAGRRLLPAGSGGRGVAGRVGTPGVGQRCPRSGCTRGVGWGGGRGAGGFLSSALRCHLFPELRTPGLCCSIPEPVVRPPTRAPLTPSAAGWSACVGQAPSLGAAACPGVSGKAVWGSGAEQNPGTRAVCVHTGVQESKGVPREAGGHPSLLWHRNPHGGI